MSYESVKEELERKGYANRITIHPNPCDTVENAARMIGCEEKLIAKTMSFLLDDKPIVIVAAGDAKIDNRKYKDMFKKKAKMVPWEEVESIIGHKPGGVCALGLNKGVVAYLDESLKRFEVVYSVAGAPECTVAFRVDELDKVIDAEWIDVCKLIEA